MNILLTILFQLKSKLLLFGILIFKVLFHTNKILQVIVYSIKSSYGKEFEIIKPGELKPDTLYQFNYDNLLPGCYEFTITDTADNGLDFWFTPEDGYGYIRVVDKGKTYKII